jgi:tight adherence protein B
MFQILIIVAVFVCVASLVGAVTFIFRGPGNTDVEKRLTALTKNGGRGAKVQEQKSSLMSSFVVVPGLLEKFVSRFLNVKRFIEQSGVDVKPEKLLMISVGLGVGTSLVYLLLSPLKALVIVVFAFFAALPFVYIWFKRGRRLKAFAGQLPNALELISRALRAGHSLPAGFQLVGDQMSAPIGPEFHRAFEQQNLGIPLEDAIQEMTERIPNLDLRFFATAVILQRQTGGDLAEILDKIGRLIRERFQIWGAIAALTGEGRLSGIVLLALPPALFLVMLKLNYDYVMLLFRDPLGQKMLAGAILMQVIGAAVIKKIITIKV